MNITVEELRPEDMKAVIENADKLVFGKNFTDRIFTMEYEVGKGWINPKIGKYRDYTFDLSTSVFHYSQEIFEGLKAYASEDGRILLFRPEENARRMNRSARRLCMPEIPEEDFLEALERLILLEKRWIPRFPGSSLYIRPTMIATERALGVHSAKSYLFFIILSPVGAYFKEGFKPVSLYVEESYVRSVVGGVGDVKTGGNYAASLLAAARAEEKGFSQVLWLDALEHRYVEEVGAMNIFFVIDGKLVTPSLTGSILPGITRKSVIELAHYEGYEVEERRITIDEVIEGAKEGRLTEAFGSGTAAVISPVKSLNYRGEDVIVKDGEVGVITEALYRKLVDIQYGRSSDPLGWVREIGKIV
jgi:branched-chain amino acid aminotransferase